MEKQLSRFARKLLLAPVEKKVPPAPILEPIRDTFLSRFAEGGEAHREKSIAPRGLQSGEDIAVGHLNAAHAQGNDRERKKQRVEEVEKAGLRGRIDAKSSAISDNKNASLACRIHLYNLPYARTRNELHMDILAAISPRGFCSDSIHDVTILHDSDTGLPNGRGTAVFKCADAAEAAATNLRGSFLGGREVRVELANRKSSGRADDGRYWNHGLRATSSTNGNIKKCYRCGGTDHLQRDCTAVARCFLCGKRHGNTGWRDSMSKHVECPEASNGVARALSASAHMDAGFLQLRPGGIGHTVTYIQSEEVRCMRCGQYGHVYCTESNFHRSEEKRSIESKSQAAVEDGAIFTSNDGNIVDDGNENEDNLTKEIYCEDIGENTSDEESSNSSDSSSGGSSSSDESEGGEESFLARSNRYARQPFRQLRLQRNKRHSDSIPSEAVASILENPTGKLSSYGTVPVWCCYCGAFGHQDYQQCYMATIPVAQAHRGTHSQVAQQHRAPPPSVYRDSRDVAKQNFTRHVVSPAKCSDSAGASTRAHAILITNMYDASQEIDVNWKQDIKLDCQEEFARFGRVLYVLVDTSTTGGYVYAWFDTAAAAETARGQLNGRRFGGRQIAVELSLRDIPKFEIRSRAVQPSQAQIHRAGRQGQPTLHRDEQSFMRCEPLSAPLIPLSEPLRMNYGNSYGYGQLSLEQQTRYMPVPQYQYQHPNSSMI